MASPSRSVTCTSVSHLACFPYYSVCLAARGILVYNPQWRPNWNNITKCFFLPVKNKGQREFYSSDTLNAILKCLMNTAFVYGPTAIFKGTHLPGGGWLDRYLKSHLLRWQISIATGLSVYLKLAFLQPVQITCQGRATSRLGSCKGSSVPI